MYGGWRGGTGLGAQPPTEEGLDERGEAPPPYKASPDAGPPDPGQAGPRSLLPTNQPRRSGSTAGSAEAILLADLPSSPSPALVAPNGLSPPKYHSLESDNRIT